MKIGTDGVLIGAWSKCQKKQIILDVGTGTGLIALMLAQRCSGRIMACDSDQKSINEAKYNFRNSKWSSRLKAIHSPIQDLDFQQKFDLIISNPPYFEVNHAFNSRQKSRQQHSLNHCDLINSVLTHLSIEGHFDLILPKKEGEIFIELCQEKKLFLQRKCYVYGHSKSKCKRLLLSFGRTRKQLEISNLIIEKDVRHTYTSDYQNLTKDFYLNF